MSDASPVLIVAEVGSVHDGSYGNALRLIDAAADCGADAVKFQTHIADIETLPDAPAPSYFKHESRIHYFSRTAFDADQWRALKARCADRGVMFLSSPFSEEAVDLLEAIGLERYKIPSGEVTNLPLLEKIASLRKPVLLSSGMSSWTELDAAVAVIRRVHDDLTVMGCTSMYPCPYEHVGLNVLAAMKRRYGLPVGLSDHTMTSYAAIAAVTLGAVVVEKHFTFSRAMYGSDAAHSMEPAEFTDMVRGIRAVEVMLGSPVDKADASRFADMKVIFEKSIVSRGEIPAGTVLTREMLAFKKPGTGIPPARVCEVVGRRAAHTVPANTLLSMDDLQ
ncbi:MAG TPA: N-acetylneuraminate synthase family protein [Vicinamibacterales bacterium]|nr:N-acetylneuraminate synthase family protein [Vicinamibacterales bacterium]